MHVLTGVCLKSPLKILQNRSHPGPAGAGEAGPQDGPAAAAPGVRPSDRYRYQER